MQCQEQTFRRSQVCKLSEKVDNEVEMEEFKEYASIGKKKTSFLEGVPNEIIENLTPKISIGGLSIKDAIREYRKKCQSKLKDVKKGAVEANPTTQAVVRPIPRWAVHISDYQPNLKKNVYAHIVNLRATNSHLSFTETASDSCTTQLLPLHSI